MTTSVIPSARISDRLVFDKIVQVLVLGAAYAKIVVPARPPRSDDDGTNGSPQAPCESREQICLEVYDQIVGLVLEHLTVETSIADSVMKISARCGLDNSVNHN